jgi:ankyrin repeat protein
MRKTFHKTRRRRSGGGVGNSPTLTDAQRASQELNSAAHSGNITKVRELLAVPGIDVNHVDNYQNTALLWAALQGHTEIVKLLLAVPGIDVNLVDDSKNTALLWAAYKGHTEIVKLLLSKEVDVNKVDTNGYTALIWAQKKGHHDIVNLLQREEEKRREPDANPSKQLVIAAISQNVEEIRRLLNVRNIDVNFIHENNTALIWGAYKGNAEIVRLLIDAGADLDYRDGGGQTALDWAISKGYPYVINLLKQAKQRRLQSVSEELLNASMGTNVVKIRELLAAGADVNYKNEYGRTALILAAGKGRTEILKLLLGFGAYINHVTNNKYTALILAANNGHTDTVQALLQAGADIRNVDNDGDTALSCARRTGHHAIVSLLEQAGRRANTTRRTEEQARNTTRRTTEQQARNTTRRTEEQARANTARRNAERIARAENATLELITAAQKGDIAKVRELLQVPLINLDYVNERGESALSFASLLGYPKIVNLLLDNGGDPTHEFINIRPSFIR